MPHLAKQCSRCKTRYCGLACQKQHWEEGGHDKLCKTIRKGGGAEQDHADNKFKEAVAVAAEACAEDTKGQTCYICTEALRWKTKEGLVRGCACRGTAGFAHVSCLAEQAKILVAEVEENNLDDVDWNARWRRWDTCSLCEQDYHGVVACALGWACRRTYVGRPEMDDCRCMAMTQLGNGLSAVDHQEDAMAVREAELFMLRRLGASERNILVVQSNLANTYDALGQSDALPLRRDVYSGYLKLNGEEHGTTLVAASNYAASLVDQNRNEEAKPLLRKTKPATRRIHGDNNDLTLRIKSNYAWALYNATGATLDDLREAVNALEDTERIARRVLGGTHPVTSGIKCHLRESRATLRAREETASSDVSSLCEALGAMAPGDAQHGPCVSILRLAVHRKSGHAVDAIRAIANSQKPLPPPS